MSLPYMLGILVVVVVVNSVSGFHIAVVAPFWRRHHLGEHGAVVITVVATAGSARNHRHCRTRSSSSLFMESLESASKDATITTTTTTKTASPVETFVSASQPLNGQDIALADAVVCGGGPAGLLTAIMLAQQQQQQETKGTVDSTPNKRRFPVIQVYDRLSPPPNPDDDAVWNDDVAKFYLIGLGGRGQLALRHFGVWDAVEQRCVAVRGRRDWGPGQSEPVERIFDAERAVPTQVLPRDKLVGVLHQHILQHHADQITLHYGVEVQPVDFNHGPTQGAVIRVSKCTDERLARMNPSAAKTESENPEAYNTVVACDTDAQYVSTPLLIAADGTVRTIANCMAALDQERAAAMTNPIRRAYFKARHAFRVTRYPDDNQRIYKTVPMKLPAAWRPDLNYSARTAEGRINYDALPANDRGDYCGVLLLQKGDPLAKADTDPTALRALLDETLPQFSALLSDAAVAAVALKPVSYLPTFRYAGPRLHEGDHTVLLGDCVHTVKPYFGLGANSALEDVKVLGECLLLLRNNRNNTAAAVRQFSKLRAPESKALVRISRELDRPGKLGFVTFVLPIILDAIFGKLAPRLFMPNVITMLQRESYTFQQVARRKRFDRLLQVLILGGGLTGFSMAANTSVQTLAKVVGKSPIVVWTTLVGSAAVFSLLNKVLAKKR